jgi:hypothetical protein
LRHTGWNFSGPSQNRRRPCPGNRGPNRPVKPPRRRIPGRQAQAPGPADPGNRPGNCHPSSSAPRFGRRSRGGIRAVQAAGL